MAGGIDSDERTNALGLFNTARSYWRSAEHLNAAEIEAVTHPEAPVTFLFCHAIELYLKAYLRGTGKSVADLKKLSHRVAHLAKAALESRLSLSPEHREILSHIDDADVAIQSRYIVTGFKNRPTNEALSSVAESLDKTVRIALVKTGLTIRQERFERPAPSQAEGELSVETGVVLLHMFKTEFDGRNVEEMARRLSMQRGILEYHLDRLRDADFAQCTGLGGDGEIYWAVTPAGRRYVVERKLVG
jgi:hypothetical protein